MKILIFSQYFWPENFRINELACLLKERGHEVQVITGMPNYPTGQIFSPYRFWSPRRENWQGITIHRLPLIPRMRGKGWQLALNYLSFVISGIFIAPFLSTGPVDRILVFAPSPITATIPAWFLKKMKKARLLLWVQDLWPESLAATGMVRSPWILKAVGLMVRLIYRGCDLILIHSKGFLGSVLKYSPDEKKIRYFPNSAEKVYAPVPPSVDSLADLGVPTGFRVLMAGNIGAAQDFPNIISAAERLKSDSEIIFVIVGDGRERPLLEENIRSRGLERKVFFVGRHPLEKMPNFFANADALLVTLRDDPVFAITLPAKVQSYLACGKPILGALNGDGAQVIEESGAGFVCSPGEPQALADIVLKLKRLDRSTREDLGRRGLVYFREVFSSDRLLQQLEGWMKNG